MTELNPAHRSAGTTADGDVRARLGVAPNFFRLSPEDPAIAANLWGFARFAYVDNPMPSLFKERLFVYLSRFCEIRYCVARHLGFLIGLGHAAGDADSPPQKIEEVLPLLRLVLPHGEALTPLVNVCLQSAGSPVQFPAPNTPEERALLACAAHVFLQTPDAARAHDALRRTLGPLDLEHLNLFLAFVRTAHFWTKLHPELKLEADIEQLLAAHETLAACILRDPEAPADGLGRQIAEELESLRELRRQHAGLATAHEALLADHEFVKHSLYEREASLRELVSTMPAGVYACDTDGFVVYCNRQAIELWGREPELDGAPWSFLDSLRFSRGDGTILSATEMPPRRVISTGKPVLNEELILDRPDRSRIHVLANVAPLRDAKGAILGAVNVFQDITQLKLREEEREAILLELERSNGELSQFSYAVSHDLQTPVRSIRTLTQLLVKREGTPPEDTQQLAEMIYKAANGMERLIESLLGYAQVGQGELHRKTISLEAVVEAVRVSLSDAIAASQARIVCGGLPQADADPVQMYQLFENLIANAIKYCRADKAPVIEIGGEAFGDGWRFSVADNGQGIPREHQEAVFEPLKRLHGGETPGTGLGLAICRAIVIRHGGRIWVESKGAGQGAKFRFTLSRTSKRSNEEAVSAATREGLRIGRG